MIVRNTLRKILLIDICLISIFSLLAQNPNMSIENWNVNNQLIYHGVPNKIKIVVEGMDCDSVLLLNNCFIINKSGECFYYITPNINCDSYKSFVVKANGTVIDSIFFDVTESPIFSAEIGGYSCRKRSGRTYILGKLYLESAHYVGYPYKVLSFSFNVLKNERVILRRLIHGDRISPYFIDLAIKNKLTVELSRLKVIGPDNYTFITDRKYIIKLCN